MEYILIFILLIKSDINKNKIVFYIKKNIRIPNKESKE